MITTKVAALKQVASMAERHADSTGILKSAQAADFYDLLATALKDDLEDEASRAAQLAATIRDAERQQLKFRELLRS